jgi:hypothetical protein
VLRGYIRESLVEMVGLAGGGAENDLAAVTAEIVSVGQVPDIAVYGNKYFEGQALKGGVVEFLSHRPEAPATCRPDSVN